MPHFFVPPANVQGGRFFLDPEESRHLALVLRKKPGDEVRLFDGADGSFRGRLDAVSPERVGGVLLAEEARKPRLPYRLRLYQGLPKGDKMELILEKMTELGAAEVVPMVTERSVARVPPERLRARLDRWRKIVLSAAKQCGQADLPEVGPPISFEEALAGCRGSLTLFPWEGETSASLKSVLPAAPPGDVALFIGPEGGFSPREADLAASRGARRVSLGPLILRTETAGFMAASALLYEYGMVK